MISIPSSIDVMEYKFMQLYRTQHPSIGMLYVKSSNKFNVHAFNHDHAFVRIFLQLFKQ